VVNGPKKQRRYLPLAEPLEAPENSTPIVSSAYDDMDEDEQEGGESRESLLANGQLSEDRYSFERMKEDEDVEEEKRGDEEEDEEEDEEDIDGVPIS